MCQPPSELPSWVDTNLKRFYLMLVGKPELIAKVTEEVERYPRDNSILGIKLKNLGLHKDNGHAFKDECSRIKTVINRLKTAPEPTLPLFNNEQ
jgi:hypothetical protein